MSLLRLARAALAFSALPAGLLAAPLAGPTPTLEKVAPTSLTSGPVLLLRVPYLEQLPRIDGSLADLPMAPSLEMGKTRLYLGWTPERLYVGVSVVDPTLTSLRQSDSTSADAAIVTLGGAELFLSSTRGDRPVYKRFKSGKLDRNLFHRRRGPEGTEVAVRRAEEQNEVAYELAAPWLTLAGALPAGEAPIPFGFRIRDRTADKVVELPFVAAGQPAGTHLVLQLAPPGPGKLVARLSAEQEVVPPGSDPKVHLGFHQTDAAAASPLRVLLDGKLLWAGDVALQGDPSTYRLKGLALSAGAHRLEVRLGERSLAGLTLVALDAGSVRARLSGARSRLASWTAGHPASRIAVHCENLAAEVAAGLDAEHLTTVLASRITSDLDDLESTLAAAIAGRPAYQGRSGVLRRAYRSSLDGTLQPYAVRLPAGLEAGTKRPLLVALSDLNDDETSFFGSGDLSAAADKHGFFVLAPHGRGLEATYRGPSALDVDEAIEDVLATLPVDTERIFLGGVAEGGTAALELALRKPDRFSGIAAFDPVPDQVAAWTQEWRKEPPLWLAGLFESRSALTHARNAAGMSVFLSCAATNPTLKAQVSKLARILKDESVRHQLVDAGPDAGTTASWEAALAFLEASAPQRIRQKVTFVTSRLSYGRAWWTEIEDVRVYGLVSSVQAERSTDGASRVELENVTALALSTAGTSVVTGAALEVTVDGTQLALPTGPDGWARMHVTAGKWSAGASPPSTTLRKRAGLEGPIEHAFSSPFIYAFGDMGPDAAAVERVARESARRWEQKFNGKVIVKPESAITKEDEAGRNLVLFGTPAASKRLPELLSAMSVRITTSAIEVGKARYEGTVLGLQLVGPNPRQRTRYAVAVTGNSVAALELLAGHDWRKPDYLVVDLNYLEDSPASALGTGYFDLDWKP
ncbi:MAG: hypothetical protein HY816_01305 [Candidatus Wallbacteria bacterium]|nr:hypothetical protein [Candidatus Wallbacteria bacterium]